MLTQMYQQNKRNLESAYGEAEEQIRPYDVIGAQPLEELRGVIMGDQDFADAPLYQRYVEAGREPLMQDLANTGSLYSGRRMEGLRDVGQQAFNAYMGNLQGLGQMGYGISSDIAGMKTGAARSLAELGQGYASDIANMRMAQAGNQGGLRNALIGGGLSAVGSFLGGPGGGALAGKLFG